jgi:uncharacterized membrane protein
VPRTGVDWPGFTVAFKGVFLEGLEVAFIVVTFGSAAGSIEFAAAGAAIALGLVCLVGAVAHRPLSQVPENALKLAVGLLLTSFGTFWAAEGVGVEWPGADLALVGLLVGYAVISWGFVRVLRGQRERRGQPTRKEAAALGTASTGD